MWAAANLACTCSMLLSYLTVGADAINLVPTGCPADAINLVSGCPAPEACIQEVVEQPLGIHWTRGGLGMELYGEERLAAMTHPFITAIIGIHKPGFKIGRQLLNCETVILGGDKAAFGSLQQAFLAARRSSPIHRGSVGGRHLKAVLNLASMPSVELTGVPASRQGLQLVPQADPHRRNIAR